MNIRPFAQIHPQLDPSVYVDPSAVVIGDVQIGADSSLWPLSVVRGDVHSIRIGERTNIQDGAIVHVTHDGPFSPGGQSTLIGDEVTVGHRALLHACQIGARCLVGMGAIVMDRAVLEPEVMLGAGALVAPGKVLASGYLYAGSPVRQVRPLSEREREFLHYSALHYVRLMQRYQPPL